MNTITCPHCSKEVGLVFFGNGWVGVCCDRIVYNKSELPEDNKYGQTDTPLLIEESPVNMEPENIGETLHNGLTTTHKPILSFFLDHIVKKPICE